MKTKNERKVKAWATKYMFEHFKDNQFWVVRRDEPTIGERMVEHSEFVEITITYNLPTKGKTK